MQFNERLILIFKVLLPVLLLAGFAAAPIPWQVWRAQQAAQVASSEEQHAAAADALRRVIEQQPWRKDLWRQVAREEIAAGRTAEAIAALQAGESAGVISPEDRMTLGGLLEQAGDAARAEAYWSRLLQTPEVLAALPADDVFERLYRLQRGRGDFSAGLQTLHAWWENNPQSGLCSYLLGQHLMIAQPESALAALVEASRLSSQFTAPVVKLRTALSQASAAEHPAYKQLVIGRGLGLVGDWDLAAEAFRQAIAISPEYAEAWAFLGEAHHHLGKGGKTELNRAYDLDPNSTAVRTLLALYWRRHNEPQKALSYLEANANQEPDEPTWEVEIANTLVEAGDLIAAQEHFERAVALRPNNPVYWVHLANFSIINGADVAGVGLPAARQAAVLAPDDVMVLDTLGWALLSQGDLDTAERILQRAVEIEPSYSPALLHLGQLYLQRKDQRQAYDYLKRAIAPEAASQGDDVTALIARRLLMQYFGEGT